MRTLNCIKYLLQKDQMSTDVLGSTHFIVMNILI